MIIMRCFPCLLSSLHCLSLGFLLPCSGWTAPPLLPGAEVLSDIKPHEAFSELWTNSMFTKRTVNAAAPLVPPDWSKDLSLVGIAEIDAKVIAYIMSATSGAVMDLTQGEVGPDDYLLVDVALDSAANAAKVLVSHGGAAAWLKLGAGEQVVVKEGAQVQKAGVPVEPPASSPVEFRNGPVTEEQVAVPQAQKLQGNLKERREARAQPLYKNFTLPSGL